eukprot:5238141-Amphidinium_carterae.1
MASGVERKPTVALQLSGPKQHFAARLGYDLIYGSHHDGVAERCVSCLAAGKGDTLTHTRRKALDN